MLFNCTGCCLSKKDNYELWSEKEIEYRRKIKTLEEKVRHRDLKLTRMSELVKVLKKQVKCSERLETVLLTRFSNLTLDKYVINKNHNNQSKSNVNFTDIVKNEVDNSKKRKNGFR